MVRVGGGWNTVSNIFAVIIFSQFIDYINYFMQLIHSKVFYN